MNSNFRQLTTAEIERLQQQGCRSHSWESVHISPTTQLKFLQNVEFSGQIKIGKTGSLEKSTSGLGFFSEIKNTRLHNCTIGDCCRIVNVFEISNYTIHEQVSIENVQSLVTTGKSTFANSTRISVINEAGGREVPIYAELNAQIAFIFARYPHKTALRDKLTIMIDRFTDAASSDRGTIGSYVQIKNCGSIENVKIDEHTQVNGAAQLHNGTILSSQSRPAFIGTGVIAKDFIIQEGSTLDSFAIIEKCFIGQSVKIAKQFSAENCCFFANCEMLHGEACSVFAGPFTVSHHKSTMLIAGMYSFYNAGSGSNFSNHMYKLGPIHQGVLERGSKNGSNSYLLWPAHIGAFTTITGSHKSHPDTADFPFSYLIGNDKSILLPGQNLRCIGTIRDAEKWPNRDRRNKKNTRDRIHFNLLNAYTVERIQNGLTILLNMQAANEDNIEKNGVFLSKRAIEKGIALYEQAINLYLGRLIINICRNAKHPVEHFKAFIPSMSDIINSSWLDIAGMLVLSSELETLFIEIEKDKIKSIADIDQAISVLHEDYPIHEFTFIHTLLNHKLGKSIQEMTSDDFYHLVQDCLAAHQLFLTELIRDAKKEFSTLVQTGYAVDKNDEQAVFSQIHGTVQEHKFLTELNSEIQGEINILQEIITQIEK